MKKNLACKFSKSIGYTHHLRIYLPLLFILFSGLLVSCGGSEENTNAAHSKNTASTSVASAPPPFVWESPLVQNIAAQFISIDGSAGYPFTFRYWNNQITSNGVDCSNPSEAPYGCMIGDDPTLKTHYQGVNRVIAPDGTSYLYLTRNGNPITVGTDHPGEILVVKMSGRNKTGESFGIDPQNDIFGIQQPRGDDFTVYSKHLNGIDFEWKAPDGSDLSGFINWKHPGSGQQAGKRFFLPVEKTCNYEPDNDKCGGGEEKRGAILVLKLADDGDPATNPNFDPTITPQNPIVDCQIDFYWDAFLADIRAFPTIGTLAVIKRNGAYLLAHTTGGGYKKETALTFYEVAENNLCTFNPITERPDVGLPVVNKLSDWNADWLLSDDSEHLGEDGWREDQSCAGCDFDWQMINFFEDILGDLYLIATDKSNVSDIDYRHDFSRLYQIFPNEYNNFFAVKYLAEKHIYLSKTIFYGNNISVDMGSFDAVGGAYVSPGGKLILYSGSHDNDLSEFIYGPDQSCNGSGLCKGLGLGEFASNFFHPPVLSLPLDQSIDEGGDSPIELGSFTDGTALNQSWQVLVDWDDRNQESFAALPGFLPSLQHNYQDGPAFHRISMTITDSTGFSGSGSFDLTINNVSPLVTISSVSNSASQELGVDISYALVGGELNLAGSYTDPGVLDTHDAEINWADGGGYYPVPVNSTDHSVSANHIYSLPGTYAVTLSITDKDGGVGSASTIVTVVTPMQGLNMVCDDLEAIADNPATHPEAARHVNKAVSHLCGNNDGRAANGAVDMLQKGNLNAAAVKIAAAVGRLESAEAMDNTLDLEPFRDFVLLVIE